MKAHPANRCDQRTAAASSLAWGLSLLLPALPLAAAEAKPGEQLEELHVYGSGYRTTGTKTELLPLEAPMSYEIYDNELLMQRQVDSVNEALRYVPGVTAENRSTVTIFDQYTIRGFETYRNYYDGLPLQYNGLWNLAPQVDAFATESIEILKGPTSVLYGAAPPGGMVNQTAKQPVADPSTLVRVRAGTHDLVELGVDSTGPLTDQLNYRLIALARDKDGQQETTEEERRTVAPSVTWQPSERVSLNLNMYYQDDPEMIPSTPLPAPSATVADIAPDSFAGDENWALFEREVTMLGYKLNIGVTDNVSFLQNFRHTDAEALQRNTYNRGLQADDRTLIRSAYFTDEAQDGFVVDNQLAWRVNVGETSHRLLLGAEYKTLDSDIRYGDTLGTATPTLDLVNPDHDQFIPAALPLDTYTEEHDIEQDQLGIYLQEELHWNALTVVAGLRWDDYESTDDTDTNFGDSVTEIDQDEVTGRVAVLYAFDNGLRPYINYSESFEPQSGTNTDTGEAFEPTTAEQIEVGVKYRSPDGATQFTLAAFDLRKQDVVINTPDFIRQTQAGEISSEGIEVMLRSALTRDLMLTASATYLDVEFADNPLDPSLEGKTPVWVAEKQANLWASWQATEALQLSAGVRYTGETEIDEQNTDTVPSYTLWDLAASYAFNDTYRIGLTVNNVADKEYVNSCFNETNCWMGAERTVELNLYAEF